MRWTYLGIKTKAGQESTYNELIYEIPALYQFDGCCRSWVDSGLQGWEDLKMVPLKDTFKSVSRRRWVASFILIGVGIAATFLIITYFFPGDTFLDRLEASYRFLCEHTTRRQFTDIIRERPWLFITPGVTIIFITGLLLPLKYWSRALLVYIAFGIGIVAGHLFW